MLPFWEKVILALIPFVWLFVGILGTSLKTHVVAFLALCVTLLLALLGWQAEWKIIGLSFLEGLVISFIPILWVILAAVFTYELSVKTGAMQDVQQFLSRLSPEPGIQAVIIAFGFGGFLESVAGFGTAVAIPTAMLVGMGFSPVRAALISLVANSVPVAFGALGIPVIVLSRITELPLLHLTRAIVWQLAIFSVLIPVLIVTLSSQKTKTPVKVWLEAVVLGGIFSFVQLGVGLFVGPELVAVVASLSVILVTLLFRFFHIVSYLPAVGRAMAPYGFLLMFVFFTRLVSLPVLKSFPFVLSWTLEGYTFSFEWFTTPGTLLFVATCVGAIFQKATVSHLFSSLKDAFWKLRFSVITITSIVIMAKLMGNTPMIRDLSVAIASLSGGLFPFLSPLLGALGTFITGSDTSSNILFGRLQRDTAMALSLDPVWIAAANTSGATAGKMISPHSISVVSSTVDLYGKEKDILKYTLFICFGYVFLLGLLVGGVTLR